MSSALGPEFALEPPAQKPEPPAPESSEAPREVAAAPTAEAGSAAPREGGYAGTPAYVPGQYVQPPESAAASSSLAAPAPGGSPYELSSASLQGTVGPPAAPPAAGAEAPASVYAGYSVPIPLPRPVAPPPEYANAPAPPAPSPARASMVGPDGYSVVLSQRPAAAAAPAAPAPAPVDENAPYRTKAMQIPAEKAEYEQEKARSGGAVVGPQMRWRGVGPLAQKRVRYISSEAERKAYELQVGENGKFYWGGKLFETQQIDDLKIVGGAGQAEDEGAIFVMTANGTLYMANQAKEIEGQYHFHHSSFLAGEPVAAAGVLKFKEVDGQVALDEISDLSGHYMPEVLHMRQVLTEFGKRGVSLVGVTLSGWNFRPPIDAMLLVQNPDKGIDELQRMAAAARAARPAPSGEYVEVT